MSEPRREAIKAAAEICEHIRVNFHVVISGSLHQAAIRDQIQSAIDKSHMDYNPPEAAQPQRSEKKLRSLANLLVCTSTERAFVQLHSYEARVDKFERIIREWLSTSGAASGTVAMETSEPQEWTPEYVKALLDYRQRNLAAVVAAHNAALAAEREVSDGLGKLNDELHQQLLAAQAAIAKHNQRGYSGDYPIIIDLSDLEQHDAEVIETNNQWWRKQTSSERIMRLENERKPLVEALIAVRDAPNTSLESKQIIGEILAQVK